MDPSLRGFHKGQQRMCRLCLVEREVAPGTTNLNRLCFHIECVTEAFPAGEPAHFRITWQGRAGPRSWGQELWVWSQPLPPSINGTSLVSPSEVLRLTPGPPPQEGP